eukprot:354194-Chlamydomonas_euryale.AAC.2
MHAPGVRCMRPAWDPCAWRRMHALGAGCMRLAWDACRGRDGGGQLSCMEGVWAGMDSRAWRKAIVRVHKGVEEVGGSRGACGRSALRTMRMKPFAVCCCDA